MIGSRNSGEVAADWQRSRRRFMLERMLVRGVAIVLALMTLGGGDVHANPPSRAAMASALAAIKPGMTDVEVRTRLGPPDDIRTEHDPGGITAARTVEIWRYGTRGHDSFATLGAVHFMANKTVQYVFGGDGKPLVTMPEPVLRDLLDALDAVPSYNEAHDPRRLIRAVNALQPLGKDKALAVIDEYLRVSSSLDNPGREGVFHVLRVLFDAAAMPNMMVGAPDRTATNAALLPRFPLAIVDDVPIVVVDGYTLAGRAEAPEHHVAWFRANATIRAHPLAPSAAAYDVIARYAAGPLGAAIAVDDSLRASIYDQIARLYGSVHRPADTVDGWFVDGPGVSARWMAYRAELAKLGARWDAATSRFVLADGNALPPEPPGFQRVWWDLPIAGATKCRLTFQRKSDTIVDVELRLELGAGSHVAADGVRFIDVATGASIAELELAALAAPSSSTTGSVTGRRLRLAVGHAIRSELRSGAHSPTLQP